MIVTHTMSGEPGLVLARNGERLRVYWIDAGVCTWTHKEDVK